MAGRPENLKPWPKSTSGNPGGRPKRDLASEIARAIFEENGDDIASAMLRTLLRGEAKVFHALADRAFGRLPRPVEHSGSNGEPVQIVFSGEKPKWLK